MPAQKVRRKLWNNLWIFLCGVAAMIFVGQLWLHGNGGLARIGPDRQISGVSLVSGETQAAGAVRAADR